MVIFGKQLAPQGGMLYAFLLLGSLMAAIFLEGGKYLFLRWRQISIDKLLGSGILLGLGVGLLTNIYQGISLVGAGFRLVLGDTSTPDLARIASQPWFDLVMGLFALNVYRIALVAMSAVLGGLVAHALVKGQQRWLWLAVIINTVYAWSYSAIGLALGNDNLIANVIVFIYQGILAALSLNWLIRQVSELPASPKQRDSKPAKGNV